MGHEKVHMFGWLFFGIAGPLWIGISTQRAWFGDGYYILLALFAVISVLSWVAVIALKQFHATVVSVTCSFALLPFILAIDIGLHSKMDVTFWYLIPLCSILSDGSSKVKCGAIVTWLAVSMISVGVRSFLTQLPTMYPQTQPNTPSTVLLLCNALFQTCPLLTVAGQIWVAVAGDPDRVTTLGKKYSSLSRISTQKDLADDPQDGLLLSTHIASPGVEIGAEDTEQSRPFSRARSVRLDVPDEEDEPPEGNWATTGKRKKRTLQYRLGNKLGQGAMAEVFLGMNLGTGELIAVKQMSHLQESELEVFQSEIEILKTLEHPHIVKYLGTDHSVAGQMMILLEYVPGGSIWQLLERFGAFRESVIRMYMKQMISGLCYLHDKGIVHGDLKGQNILVSDRGEVKLTDFGTSAPCPAAQSVHVPQDHEPAPGQAAIVGTVLWMAPEVCQGNGASTASDIWSVGCTLIEMATAKPPWTEKKFANQLGALFCLSKGEDVPICPPQLSSQAKDFLNRCIALEPRQRLTAAQLAEHPFLHECEEQFNSFASRAEMLGPGMTLKSIRSMKSVLAEETAAPLSPSSQSQSSEALLADRDIDLQLTYLHHRASSQYSIAASHMRRATASRGMSRKVARHNSNNLASQGSGSFSMAQELAEFGSFIEKTGSQLASEHQKQMQKQLQQQQQPHQRENSKESSNLFSPLQTTNSTPSVISGVGSKYLSTQSVFSGPSMSDPPSLLQTHLSSFESSFGTEDESSDGTAPTGNSPQRPHKPSFYQPHMKCAK